MEQMKLLADPKLRHLIRAWSGMSHEEKPFCGVNPNDPAVMFNRTISITRATCTVCKEAACPAAKPARSFGVMICSRRQCNNQVRARWQRPERGDNSSDWMTAIGTPSTGGWVWRDINVGRTGEVATYRPHTLSSGRTPPEGLAPRIFCISCGQEHRLPDGWTLVPEVDRRTNDSLYRYIQPEPPEPDLNF